MKKLTIVHVALASSVTDGMSYQENFLSDQNAKDGHNVIIITNTSKFINGKITDVDEEDIILSNGVRLIRIAFDKIINKKISLKVRKSKKLFFLLKELKPDIIFSHSTSYYSLKDCVKYVKKYPEVRMVADNHASFYNSGHNFASKFFLHKGLYRYVTKKSIKYLKTYYCIGLEEEEFARKIYGVPKSLIKFYPLGGTVLDDENYVEKRKKIRKELAIDDNSILFMHSGKFDILKKTKDLIESFSKTSDKRFKLIIIGIFDKQIEFELMNLINRDKRILYLGWKNNNELVDYLCASDIYCQPGSMSATLQNAICCRCAIMSFPHDTYYKKLNNNNFYWVKDKDNIIKFFKEIENNNLNIVAMKNNSYELARSLLDYKKLAERLYLDCGYDI